MILLLLTLLMQNPEITITLAEDSLGLCAEGSCGYQTGFPESDSLEITFVEESGTIHFLGIISGDMNKIVMDDSTTIFIGDIIPELWRE